MRCGIGVDARGVALLVWLAPLGCTSSDVPTRPRAEQRGEPPRRFPDDPACDIRADDDVCKVDADCEYVGTRVERTGQCCYDPCGSGATVNQAAANRLLPARDRINTGPPRDGCSGQDTKCSAGYPTCTNGRCTLRPG